jgi:hypothetical protein
MPKRKWDSGGAAALHDALGDLSERLQGYEDAEYEMEPERRVELDPHEQAERDIQQCEVDLYRDREIDQRQRADLWNRMRQMSVLTGQAGNGYSFGWKENIPQTWGHWFLANGVWTSAIGALCTWKFGPDTGAVAAAGLNVFRLFAINHHYRRAQPVQVGYIPPKAVPALATAFVEAVSDIVAPYCKYAALVPLATGVMKLMPFFKRCCVSAEAIYHRYVVTDVDDVGDLGDRFVSGEDPRLVGHGLKDVLRPDPMTATCVYTRSSSSFLDPGVYTSTLRPSLEYVVETTCARVSRPGSLPDDASKAIQIWIQSTQNIFGDRLAIFNGTNVIRDSQAVAFGLFMSEERRTRKVPFTLLPRPVKDASTSMGTGWVRYLFQRYPDLSLRLGFISGILLLGLAGRWESAWESMWRAMQPHILTCTTLPQLFSGLSSDSRLILLRPTRMSDQEWPHMLEGGLSVISRLSPRTPTQV